MAGRSRVIAVNREDDVIETLKDLIQAAKQKPSRYCRDLENFWDDLDQCITDQLAELTAAERTADSLKRVKAAAEQVVKDCNAELEDE